MKNNFRASVTPWLPTVCVMGLIFFASSLRGEDVPLPNFSGSDKIAHLIAYGLLGLSLAWGHFRANPNAPVIHRSGALLLWSVGALYGMSDEFHQHFVPNRSVSVYDWLADATGVALGLWVFVRGMRYRKVGISAKP